MKVQIIVVIFTVFLMLPVFSGSAIVAYSEQSPADAYFTGLYGASDLDRVSRVDWNPLPHATDGPVIWEGDVVLKKGETFGIKPGNSQNSSDVTIEVLQTTPLGALHAAASEGGFTYHVYATGASAVVSDINGIRYNLDSDPPFLWWFGEDTGDEIIEIRTDGLYGGLEEGDLVFLIYAPKKQDGPVTDADVLYRILMQVHVIDGQDDSPPIGNFTAKPLSGAVPLRIQFTDLSSGIPTAWEWDFGDGKVSFEKDPAYIYTKAGNYSVSLTVSNPYGTDTVTVGDYINATGADPGSKPGNGTPLTSGVIPAYSPAIDDEMVVWLEGTPSVSTGVVMYNISTGVTTTITNDTDPKVSPCVEGDRIVWASRDVWLHDCISGITVPLTNNSLSEGLQKNPDISGEWVVWEDFEDYQNGSSLGNHDIVIYNLAEQRKEKITDDSYYQGQPAIDGDFVVWTDDREYPDSDDTEIYLYDIGSGEERRITNDSLQQEYPGISGDRIVWVEYSSPLNDTADGSDIGYEYADICLYNITTGEKSVVSTGEIALSGMDDFFVNWRLSISGDSIVWHDNSSGNRDIYFYDVKSGLKTQITSDTADQVYPAVSGTRVVWEDNRSGNRDIFLVEINASTRDPPVATPPPTPPPVYTPPPYTLPPTPPPVYTPPPYTLPPTPPPVYTPPPYTLPPTPPPVYTPPPYTPPPTPPPVYTPPPYTLPPTPPPVYTPPPYTLPPTPPPIYTPPPYTPPYTPPPYIPPPFLFLWLT
jgi:TolB protein